MGDPVPLKLFTNQSSALNATLRTYRLGLVRRRGGRLVDTRTLPIPHGDASGYDQFGPQRGDLALR